MKTMNRNFDFDRQDYVDGAIFELVQALAPKGADKIEPSLDWVGQVRDEIQKVIVDRYGCCTEREFYPYVDE